ncbi:E3 ubiquitin-protein ligase SINA-like 10 [Arachis duranensis]|uniref:RING-type E3 ubiquitin transferase n=1 Tax=Arachis duranensis TaxID=130453 RepID=A0A6P5MZL1_ARADU|nr:E3 ubiquitin-protein ligase SINA-like 10 [Arachis duranensis]
MKKVIAARSRKRKQDRSCEKEEQVPDDDEPVSVKASGKKGSSAQDKSFSFFLSDPDVLDCPICFNPLTTPVYQCENGHVACSACCSRILEKKCASCFLSIGSIRSRALEKVLESIKVPCANAEYGCTETLRYSDKSGHESQCNFVPCSCPHSDCNFVSSFSDLPAHYRTEHGSSASAGVRFSYDKPFKVTLDSDDDVTILQEVNGEKLFIVHNFVAGLGNAVSVFCIQPELLPNYRCQISAKSNGCSLEMNSFTKNIQNSAMARLATILSSRFLVIPTDYFGAGQPRNFEICIFRSYE